MPPERTQETISSQLQSWWSSIPLITKSVFAICLSGYVLTLVFGLRIYSVCYDGALLLRHPTEIFRAFSAIFFHVGIFHLAFNMLTFLPVGGYLERSIGSLILANLIGALALSAALIHAVVASLLALTNHGSGCAVGLSGVLFGLIAIENHMAPGGRRSLFGLVEVPKVWYPWALLVLIQLLSPQVSFVGHLSGLLAGEAYSRGYLSYLVASASRAARIESHSLMTRLVRLQSYIMNTGNDVAGIAASLLPVTNQGNSASFPMPGTITRNFMGPPSGAAAARQDAAAGGPFVGTGRTLGTPAAAALGPSAAQAAAAAAAARSGQQTIGFVPLAGGAPIAINVLTAQNLASTPSNPEAPWTPVSPLPISTASTSLPAPVTTGPGSGPARAYAAGAGAGGGAAAGPNTSMSASGAYLGPGSGSGGAAAAGPGAYASGPSAASAGPGAPASWEASRASLLEMGFPRDKVDAALARAGGDLERAVEFLGMS